MKFLPVNTAEIVENISSIIVEEIFTVEIMQDNMRLLKKDEICYR